MRRTIFNLAVLVVASVVGFPAVAQEATERESIEELRREVRELRQLVEELSKRLDALPYERLPRAADTPPDSPARESLRRATDPEPHSKLRFPLDVERGTAAPFMELRRKLDPPRSPYERFDKSPLPPRR